MKKFFVIMAAVLLPLLASAQAQINTKKVKISDFTQKITKVVMTGNMLFDAVMKEETASRWRISPYEFCTLNEFEALKENDAYYFLIPTKGQFKKETEPGLMFLTLIKGGKEASEGIDAMLEVVSLPIASAEDPSGREFVMLPALLTIIQDYTLASMESDTNAYVGLSNYSKNLVSAQGMKIVFAQSDLGATVGPECREAYLKWPICTVSDEQADELIKENAPETLISYVVAPTDAKAGSYCYKMLIDTQSYKLYLFRKHKITPKFGVGFMDYDIRSIYMTLTNKKK